MLAWARRYLSPSARCVEDIRASAGAGNWIIAEAAIRANEQVTGPSTLERMYMPQHFSWTDLTQVGSFVDAAQSAHLVTFDGTRPIATLLPVIWDRPEPAGNGSGPEGEADPASYGRLLGHVAIANPQWKTAAPGAEALAIVSGPEAYISPSWYEAKARHGRVVPTWNYEIVHLTGPVTFHQDSEWLRALVTRLTRRHEGGREHPWAVTDAPPDYIDGQLRAIVGVELAITSIEAKQKLSQNRSELDREGVVAGLRDEPGGGNAAIADLMAGQLTAGGA
jgi:transcriptional regulator